VQDSATQTPSTPTPYIVTIVKPKSDLEGLSDVLLGSLGLAGMFVLGALILAALFAGVLFLWRSRRGVDPDSQDDTHII
jgi:hypothetical protein